LLHNLFFTSPLLWERSTPKATGEGFDGSQLPFYIGFNMQHVIIGILINSEKKILVAQRLSHQIKAGFWEFPGGKVEEGESAFKALQREFLEEIGVQISQAEPWVKFDYVYPHKHVLLDVWFIKDFSGMPIGAEGQPIRWISANEMTNLSFPEGNKIIIEKLIDYLQK